MAFGQIPSNIPNRPEPFTLHVSDEELTKLKILLELSRLGQNTWWNQQEGIAFGTSSKWLAQAKDEWLNRFDWRQQESAINSFPNFYMTIDDEEYGPVKLHFIALFSQKADAIPLTFLHGWPGSFMEFLPILGILIKKYTPETLPYHVVVPSLPGYGLSSEVPIAKEFTIDAAARSIHWLMLGLGFGSGYVTQGGDVGSMLSSILLRDYKECKAAHFNLLVANPQDSDENMEGLLPEEREGIKLRNAWRLTGTAYALEHGTRPATIGHVLSSSPLAGLAWIGEKYLEWPDVPIALHDILAIVSLYWFTSTFSSALYPYRQMLLSPMQSNTSKTKPIGYSWFKRDLFFVPKVLHKDKFPNMVHYKAHSKGGHFPALERPEVLLQDVEEFIAKAGNIISKD